MIVVVVAACTSDPDAASTTLAVAPTTTVVTPSTSPPPEVFHLFAGQGYDLDVFRSGLIESERDAVDRLFDEATLYEADLVLRPDLTGFDGRYSIAYTNNEDITLDEVVFRLFPNVSDGAADISGLTVDGVMVDPVYELQRSVLRVPVPALAPGESVEIAMDLAVTVPIDEGGKYGTFLLDEGILSLAHSLPLAAVYDDEGWNLEIAPPSGDSVYSESAFFLVRLANDSNATVVTSGSLISTETLEDGTTASLYAGGPMRDFYMAAGDFELVQGRSGSTVVNSYAPAAFRDRSQMILDFTISSLNVFDDLYGTYPFSELDVVSTRTLALGVEYPGAIAMAMGHYDPAEEYDDATIISTIVHEAAHQWFYSTVGNDQLDEPWLDEAMAQYATWKWWGRTQGEVAADGFAQHLDSRWARVDYADIPIGLPVADYEGSEYGAIVYGRGPLEIGNLAEPLGGQEQLDEFLAQYAADFKYGIATSAGFQEAAEAWCECDLTAQFDAVVYPR